MKSSGTKVLDCMVCDHGKGMMSMILSIRNKVGLYLCLALLACTPQVLAGEGVQIGRAHV